MTKSYFLSYKEWLNFVMVVRPPLFWVMTKSYFLSYKEWHNFVMIFRSCDFSFLSNERPRLTTRAQVFQNQKYSNCRHCSLLSALIFRVGGHLHFSFVLVTSAFLFRVGGGCKYLHLHFFICISLSCWWTSAFLFRVGGHLYFSFVSVDICTYLSCWWTSAFLFRVGYICTYLSC